MIIAKDLELEDRIEKMHESECYITVKDHKEDFPHKISCRLINPSKSDIGKLSKIILDKINSDVLSSVQVNQWTNSQAAIQSFKNIRNRNNASFIVFDIESFYPSISLELFHKAMNFVKTICDIPEKDISIIMQSRRTFLFNNKEPWLKKSGNEESHVPMGCFDGGEVCELVCVYILHLLKTIMRKENVGFYRDDGLGILRNSSGPDIERKRKQIIQIFKSCGLNSTIKANLKTADFLDARLDLVNNTYQPYRKPNSETVYINKHSNHPPNILKELLKAFNKRITDISCNRDIFDAAKTTYKQVLGNSGFSEELKYKNKDGEEQTRN